MAIDQVYNVNPNVIVTGGLVNKGAYAAGTDYAVGDAVSYNGTSYVMFNNAGAGTVPTNTTYWQVLAAKGDTGTAGSTGATGNAGVDGIDGTNGTNGLSYIWKGTYNSATAYSERDCVFYDGNGYICIQSGTNKQPNTEIAYWNLFVEKPAISLEDVYPIGSIYIEATGINPATTFGFGTWEAVGAGKTLVGVDTADADFESPLTEGGSKTVQSSAQTFAGTASTSVVNHTHTSTVYVGTTDGTYGTFDSSSTTPGTAKTITTGDPNSGGVASYTPAGTNTPGAATSVVQPYVTVFFWGRVA